MQDVPVQAPHLTEEGQCWAAFRLLRFAQKLWIARLTDGGVVGIPKPSAFLTATGRLIM